ncbi:MAG: hypothetical protein H7A40_02590 [Chlamydiales bacterium]|nr:hypothetical protein [Chlamydiales bacterium]
MKSNITINHKHVVDEGHLYLRNAQFEEFTKWFGRQPSQFWFDYEQAFLDGLLLANVFEGVLEIKASKVFAAIFCSCDPLQWRKALDAYVEKFKEPKYFNNSTLDFAIYLFDDGLYPQGKELAEAFVRDVNFKDKVSDYQEFLREHPSQNAKALLTMFSAHLGREMMSISIV